jgi:hypothetical protein
VAKKISAEKERLKADEKAASGLRKKLAKAEGDLAKAASDIIKG